MRLAQVDRRPSGPSPFPHQSSLSTYLCSCFFGMMAGWPQAHVCLWLGVHERLRRVPTPPRPIHSSRTTGGRSHPQPTHRAHTCVTPLHAGAPTTTMLRRVAVCAVLLFGSLAAATNKANPSGCDGLRLLFKASPEVSCVRAEEGWGSIFPHGRGDDAPGSSTLQNSPTLHLARRPPPASPSRWPTRSPTSLGRTSRAAPWPSRSPTR